MPPLGTAAFVGLLPLAVLLLDAGAAVDGEGAGGFTALHTAAVNGDAALARTLLARGADRTIRNGAGRTPAELASDDELRRLLG